MQNLKLDLILWSFAIQDIDKDLNSTNAIFGLGISFMSRVPKYSIKPEKEYSRFTFHDELIAAVNGAASTQLSKEEGEQMLKSASKRL